MMQQGVLGRKKTRALTVEFWRFLFTVLVCIYHSEIYFGNPKLLPSGESAVEFFYLLSGFLLMLSVTRDLRERHIERVSPKEARLKAWEYVRKKAVAIYPALLVVLILTYFVYPFTVQNGFGGSFGSGFGGGFVRVGKPAFWSQLKKFMNSEWEFLFLVGTPFGYNDGAAPIVPMWFLTGLLIVGYVYTYLAYRHYELFRFLAPLLGILGITYFTLNSTLILDFYVKMGLFTAGMVRAVSSMALGATVFFIYDRLKDRKFSAMGIALLSLLEVYAIYRFFSLTLWQPVSLDNYRRTVYIMVILLLAFLNVTYLSRLLNRRIWHHAGKITITMYLAHFGLVPVYLTLLNSWKSYLRSKAYFSPSAKQMLNFLKDTGNFDDRFRMRPLSLKDIILYMTLVIVVSVLINLLIAYYRKFVVRPLKEYFALRRAARERAEAEPAAREEALEAGPAAWEEAAEAESAAR